MAEISLKRRKSSKQPTNQRNCSNIVAAFRGMHVSPAKHSYARLPRKCDYPTDTRTDRQTDAGQSDPYVLLCFAGDTINHPFVLLCFAGYTINHLLLVMFKFATYIMIFSTNSWCFTCIDFSIHTFTRHMNRLNDLLTLLRKDHSHKYCKKLMFTYWRQFTVRPNIILQSIPVMN